MARNVVLAVLTAVAITFGAQPVVAQSPVELEALRDDIDALKAGQAAIQKDLQEIKALLRARAAGPPAPPQEAVVGVDGAPFKGKKDARVTLVDFTDYQ